MSQHYLHEDGLGPPTILPTGLLAEGGVEDLVGWDPGVGHPLLSSQHPDDHVWHAVLGLAEQERQTRVFPLQYIDMIFGLFQAVNIYSW